MYAAGTFQAAAPMLELRASESGSQRVSPCVGPLRGMPEAPGALHLISHSLRWFIKIL